MRKSLSYRRCGIDGLEWLQRPVDAGQMLDVWYAADDEYRYLYRRATDRRDGTVVIERAAIDAAQGEWLGIQNGWLPEIDGDWEPVYADDVADVIDALVVRGPAYSGDCAADMASEWLGCGFSAAAVADWCDVGVWEPGIAEQFVAAGLSPDDVAAAAERMIDALPADADPCDYYEDGSPIYDACQYSDAAAIIAAAQAE